MNKRTIRKAKKNDGGHPPAIRIISALLIMAFVVSDIVWASPDNFASNPSQSATLAPPSFLTDVEDHHRFYAKTIECLVEQDSGIPRRNLTIEGVERILYNNRDKLNNLLTNTNLLTPYQEGMRPYKPKYKDGKVVEVFIPISPKYILRYFDPERISETSEYETANATSLNKFLHRQLLKTSTSSLVVLPEYAGKLVTETARSSSSGRLTPLDENPLIRPRGNVLETGETVYGWEWYNFNPSVTPVKIDGRYYMVYRTFSKEKVSCFGLAWSEDLVHWERLDWPIFTLERQHSAEDPHINISDGNIELYYVDYDGENYDTYLATASLEDFLKLAAAQKDYIAISDQTLRHTFYEYQKRKWQNLWQIYGCLFGEGCEKDDVPSPDGEFVLRRPWSPDRADRGKAGSIWVSFKSDKSDKLWSDRRELFLEPDFGDLELKIGAGTNIIKTAYGYVTIIHVIKGEPYEDAFSIDRNPRRRYEAKLVLFDIATDKDGKKHLKIKYISPRSVLRPSMPYDDVELAKKEYKSARYDYTPHGEAHVGFPVIFPTSLIPDENGDDLTVLYGSGDSVISGARGSLSELIPEYLRIAILESKIKEPKADEDGRISVNRIIAPLGARYAHKKVLAIPFRDGDWDSGFRIFFDGKEVGFYDNSSGEGYKRVLPNEYETRKVTPAGTISVNDTAYMVGKEQAGKTLTIYPYSNKEWNSGFRVFDSGRILAMHNAVENRFTRLQHAAKIGIEGRFVFSGVRCAVGNENKGKTITVVPYSGGDWNSGFRVFYNTDELGWYNSFRDTHFVKAEYERKVRADGRLEHEHKIYNLGASFANSTAKLTPVASENWLKGFIVECKNTQFYYVKDASGDTRLEYAVVLSGRTGNVSWDGRSFNLLKIYEGIKAKIVPRDGNWSNGFNVIYRGELLASYDAISGNFERAYGSGKMRPINEIKFRRVSVDGRFVVDKTRYSIGRDLKGKKVLITPFTGRDWLSGFRVILEGREIGWYDAASGEHFRRAPLEVRAELHANPPKESRQSSSGGLTRRDFLLTAAAAIAAGAPALTLASKAAAALTRESGPKGTASYKKGLASVIQVDPSVNELDLDVMTAGRIGKSASLSSILKSADTASRRAIAGINANFFIMRFPWRYHPLGLLIGRDRTGQPKIYKYDGFNRAAFVIAEDFETGKREFFIKAPGFIPYLQLTGGTEDSKIKINEINATWRNGSKDHIVAYNDYFGKVPAVKDGALRVRIRKDGSINVVKKGDPDIISEGEWIVILSRRGPSDSAAKAIPALLEDNVRAEMNSQFGGKLNSKNVVTAIMGGPELLKDGRIIVDESLKAENVRGIRGDKPRTGIGITWSGKIILVTVKNPVTLDHFAKIMKGLGARDALNLDGGRSVARVWKPGHPEKVEGSPLPGGMIVTWERIPWTQRIEKKKDGDHGWLEKLVEPEPSILERFFPWLRKSEPAPPDWEKIIPGGRGSSSGEVSSGDIEIKSGKKNISKGEAPAIPLQQTSRKALPVGFESDVEPDYDAEAEALEYISSILSEEEKKLYSTLRLLPEDGRIALNQGKMALSLKGLASYQNILFASDNYSNIVIINGKRRVIRIMIFPLTVKNDSFEANIGVPLSYDDTAKMWNYEMRRFVIHGDTSVRMRGKMKELTIDIAELKDHPLLKDFYATCQTADVARGSTSGRDVSYKWDSKEKAMANIKGAVSIHRSDIIERYNRLDALTGEEKERLKEDICGITRADLNSWGVGGAFKKKAYDYFGGKHRQALVETFGDEKLGLTMKDFKKFAAVKAESLYRDWNKGEEFGVHNVRAAIDLHRPDITLRYEAIETGEIADEDEIEILRQDIYSSIGRDEFEAWKIDRALDEDKASYFHGSYVEALQKVFPLVGLRPFGFHLRWKTKDEAVESLLYIFSHHIPDVLAAYDRLKGLEENKREDLRDAVKREILRIRQKQFHDWGAGSALIHDTAPYFHGSYAEALMVVFPLLELKKEDFVGKMEDAAKEGDQKSSRQSSSGRMLIEKRPQFEQLIKRFQDREGFGKLEKEGEAEIDHSLAVLKIAAALEDRGAAVEAFQKDIKVDIVDTQEPLHRRTGVVADMVISLKDEEGLVSGKYLVVIKSGKRPSEVIIQDFLNPKRSAGRWMAAERYKTVADKEGFDGVILALDKPCPGYPVCEVVPLKEKPNGNFYLFTLDQPFELSWRPVALKPARAKKASPIQAVRPKAARVVEISQKTKADEATSASSRRMTEYEAAIVDYRDKNYPHLPSLSEREILERIIREKPELFELLPLERAHVRKMIDLIQNDRDMRSYRDTVIRHRMNEVKDLLSALHLRRIEKRRILLLIDECLDLTYRFTPYGYFMEFYMGDPEGRFYGYGFSHTLQVLINALTILKEDKDLKGKVDLKALTMAILFHDIGNGISRTRHNVVSKYMAKGLLLRGGYSAAFAEKIARLVSACHRESVKEKETEELYKSYEARMIADAGALYDALNLEAIYDIGFKTRKANIYDASVSFKSRMRHLTRARLYTNPDTLMRLTDCAFLRRIPEFYMTEGGKNLIGDSITSAAGDIKDLLRRRGREWLTAHEIEDDISPLLDRLYVKYTGRQAAEAREGGTLSSLIGYFRKAFTTVKDDGVDHTRPACPEETSPQAGRQSSSGMPVVAKVGDVPQRDRLGKEDRRSARESMSGQIDANLMGEADIAEFYKARKDNPAICDEVVLLMKLAAALTGYSRIAFFGGDVRDWFISKLRREGIVNTDRYIERLFDEHGIVRPEERAGAEKLFNRIVCAMPRRLKLDNDQRTFLDRHHNALNYFKETVIPAIIPEKLKKGDRSITISMIGSSTGEEMASLYCYLYEAFETNPAWGPINTWQIRIDGIDISKEAIKEARRRLIKEPENLFSNYYSGGKVEEILKLMKETAPERRKEIFSVTHGNISYEPKRRTFLAGSDVIVADYVLHHITTDSGRKVIQDLAKRPAWIMTNHMEVFEASGEERRGVERKETFPYAPLRSVYYALAPPDDEDTPLESDIDDVRLDDESSVKHLFDIPGYFLPTHIYYNSLLPRKDYDRTLHIAHLIRAIKDRRVRLSPTVMLGLWQVAHTDNAIFNRYRDLAQQILDAVSKRDDDGPKGTSPTFKNAIEKRQSTNGPPPEGMAAEEMWGAAPYQIYNILSRQFTQGAPVEELQSVTRRSKHSAEPLSASTVQGALNTLVHLGLAKRTPRDTGIIYKAFKMKQDHFERIKPILKSVRAYTSRQILRTRLDEILTMGIVSPFISIEELRRHLAAFPDNMAVRVALINRLSKKKKFSEAEEMRQKGRELFPEARVFEWMEADILFESGRFNDAIPIYKRQLDEDERIFHKARVCHRLGDSYRRSPDIENRYIEARKYYLLAWQYNNSGGYDPKAFVSLFAIGESYVEEGRFLEGQVVMRLVREVSGEFADVRRHWNMALQAIGDVGLYLSPEGVPTRDQQFWETIAGIEWARNLSGAIPESAATPEETQGPQDGRESSSGGQAVPIEIYGKKYLIPENIYKNIRRAEPKDMNAILDLSHLIFKHFFLESLDIEDIEKRFAPPQGKLSHPMWVYCDETGEVKGYIYAKVTDISRLLKREGMKDVEICEYAVSDDYQHRGIGTALFATMMDYMIKTYPSHIDAFHLSAIDMSEESGRLARKFGFAATDLDADEDEIYAGGHTYYRFIPPDSQRRVDSEAGRAERRDPSNGRPGSPQGPTIDELKELMLEVKATCVGLGACKTHAVELATRLIKKGIDAQVVKGSFRTGPHFWVETTADDGYVLDAYPEGMGGEWARAARRLGDERFVIIKKSSDVGQRLYKGVVDPAETMCAKLDAADDVRYYKARIAIISTMLDEMIQALSKVKGGKAALDRDNIVMLLRRRLTAAEESLKKAEEAKQYEHRGSTSGTGDENIPVEIYGKAYLLPKAIVDSISVAKPEDAPAIRDLSDYIYGKNTRSTQPIAHYEGLLSEKMRNISRIWVYRDGAGAVKGYISVRIRQHDVYKDIMIRELAVDKDARRRGIARALFAIMMREMEETTKARQWDINGFHLDAVKASSAIAREFDFRLVHGEKGLGYYVFTPPIEQLRASSSGVPPSGPSPETTIQQKTIRALRIMRTLGIDRETTTQIISALERAGLLWDEDYQYYGLAVSELLKSGVVPDKITKEDILREYQGKISPVEQPKEAVRPETFIEEVAARKTEAPLIKEMYKEEKPKIAEVEIAPKEAAVSDEVAASVEAAPEMPRTEVPKVVEEPGAMLPKPVRTELFAAVTANEILARYKDNDTVMAQIAEFKREETYREAFWDTFDKETKKVLFLILTHQIMEEYPAKGQIFDNDLLRCQVFVTAREMLNTEIRALNNRRLSGLYGHIRREMLRLKKKGFGDALDYFRAEVVGLHLLSDLSVAEQIAFIKVNAGIEDWSRVSLEAQKAMVELLANQIGSQPDSEDFANVTVNEIGITLGGLYGHYYHLAKRSRYKGTAMDLLRETLGIMAAPRAPARARTELPEGRFGPNPAKKPISIRELVGSSNRQDVIERKLKDRRISHPQEGEGAISRVERLGGEIYLVVQFDSGRRGKFGMSLVLREGLLELVEERERPLTEGLVSEQIAPQEAELNADTTREGRQSESETAPEEPSSETPFPAGRESASGTGFLSKQSRPYRSIEDIKKTLLLARDGKSYNFFRLAYTLRHLPGGWKDELIWFSKENARKGAEEIELIPPPQHGWYTVSELINLPYSPREPACREEPIALLNPDIDNMPISFSEPFSITRKNWSLQPTISDYQILPAPPKGIEDLFNAFINNKDRSFHGIRCRAGGHFSLLNIILRKALPPSEYSTGYPNIDTFAAAFCYGPYYLEVDGKYPTDLPDIKTVGLPSDYIFAYIVPSAVEKNIILSAMDEALRDKIIDKLYYVTESAKVKTYDEYVDEITQSGSREETREETVSKPKGTVGMEDDVRESASGAADANEQPSPSNLTNLTRLELEPRIEFVHTTGEVLLQSLTSCKTFPVTHNPLPITRYPISMPRIIPINVDIFVDIPDTNKDIIERFLEILALKQLYINRHTKGIEFEFISRSNNQELLERIEDIYNGLDLVQNRSLKLHKDNNLGAGFTITDLTDDVTSYPERCLFLEKRIEADETESGLIFWNGLLDLAISSTLLLDYEEGARQVYYPKLAELYNKLRGDGQEAIDEKLLALLFNDDLTKSHSIAQRFAIPPIGRYNINELREMYIRMRSLAEAA